MWGAIATGLFATVVDEGQEGFFITGSVSQLSIQVIGVVATLAFAGIVTYVLLIVLDKTMGLRVTEECESLGLDQIEHGESGYNL